MMCAPLSAMLSRYFSAVVSAVVITPYHRTANYCCTRDKISRANAPECLAPSIWKNATIKSPVAGLSDHQLPRSKYPARCAPPHSAAPSRDAHSSQSWHHNSVRVSQLKEQKRACKRHAAKCRKHSCRPNERVNLHAHNPYPPKSRKAAPKRGADRGPDENAWCILPADKTGSSTDSSGDYFDADDC